MFQNFQARINDDGWNSSFKVAQVSNFNKDAILFFSVGGGNLKKVV